MRITFAKFSEYLAEKKIQTACRECASENFGVIGWSVGDGKDEELAVFHRQAGSDQGLRSIGTSEWCLCCNNCGALRYFHDEPLITWLKANNHAE